MSISCRSCGNPISPKEKYVGFRRPYGFEAMCIACYEENGGDSSRIKKRAKGSMDSYEDNGRPGERTGFRRSRDLPEAEIRRREIVEKGVGPAAYARTQELYEPTIPTGPSIPSDYKPKVGTCFICKGQYGGVYASLTAHLKALHSGTTVNKYAYLFPAISYEGLNRDEASIVWSALEFGKKQEAKRNARMARLTPEERNKLWFIGNKDARKAVKQLRPGWDVVGPFYVEWGETRSAHNVAESYEEGGYETAVFRTRITRAPAEDQRLGADPFRQEVEKDCIKCGDTLIRVGKEDAEEEGMYFTTFRCKNCGYEVREKRYKERGVWMVMYKAPEVKDIPPIPEYESQLASTDLPSDDPYKALLSAPWLRHCTTCSGAGVVYTEGGTKIEQCPQCVGVGRFRFEENPMTYIKGKRRFELRGLKGLSVGMWVKVMNVMQTREPEIYGPTPPTVSPVTALSQPPVTYLLIAGDRGVEIFDNVEGSGYPVAIAPYTFLSRIEDFVGERGRLRTHMRYMKGEKLTLPWDEFYHRIAPQMEPDIYRMSQQPASILTLVCTPEVEAGYQVVEPGGFFGGEGGYRGWIKKFGRVNYEPVIEQSKEGVFYWLLEQGLTLPEDIMEMLRYKERKETKEPEEHFIELWRGNEDSAAGIKWSRNQWQGWIQKGFDIEKEVTRWATHEESCKSCEGTGLVKISCDVCFGLGKSYEAGKGGSMVEIPCEKCKGSGKLDVGIFQFQLTEDAPERKRYINEKTKLEEAIKGVKGRRKLQLQMQLQEVESAESRRLEDIKATVSKMTCPKCHGNKVIVLPPTPAETVDRKVPHYIATSGFRYWQEAVEYLMAHGVPIKLEEAEAEIAAYKERRRRALAASRAAAKPPKPPKPPLIKSVIPLSLEEPEPAPSATPPPSSNGAELNSAPLTLNEQNPLIEAVVTGLAVGAASGATYAGVREYLDNRKKTKKSRSEE